MQYRIAELTFRVLHDSAPWYLAPLVAVADLPRSASYAGLSGCRSSSLERSVRGRRLIVIIADFPPYQLKTHLFQLSYPHLIFWPFDWHRYSGPCSDVRYLGHSKHLCLLTYTQAAYSSLLALQWTLNVDTVSHRTAADTADEQNCDFLVILRSKIRGNTASNMDYSQIILGKSSSEVEQSHYWLLIIVLILSKWYLSIWNS